MSTYPMLRLLEGILHHVDLLTCRIKGMIEELEAKEPVAGEVVFEQSHTLEISTHDAIKKTHRVVEWRGRALLEIPLTVNREKGRDGSGMFHEHAFHNRSKSAEQIGGELISIPTGKYRVKVTISKVSE